MPKGEGKKANMRMKKPLSIGLVSLLLLSIATVMVPLSVSADEHPAQAIWVDPGSYLTIPDLDNLTEGDTFTVDVMINITDPDGPGPATGLFGFEYKLKWNATVLEAESIQYHNPWPPASSLIVRNETGVLPDGRHYHLLAIIALAVATPFTGTYSLCTYTFHVNYQPYYPEPDYIGSLDIYDIVLVNDRGDLIAHTTYDGQYRIPSRVPVHDLAITGIALSKTIVGQGYSMNITVTVENQGDLPETFNATAYYNNTAIILPNGKNYTTVILADENSTNITFTWNTTGVPYGDYTLSANVSVVPGETDTDDNSYTDGTVRVSIPGDVNGDRIVDIYDLVYMGSSFGAEEGKPPPPGAQPYKPNADINGDGILDIYDVVIVGIHYGETYP